MLNAGIILQGQAPQFQDPLDMMAKTMSMKQMYQQGQMNDVQMRKVQEAEQEDRQLKEIFSRNIVQDPTTGESNLDKKAVLADLYKLAPNRALEIQQTWQKQDNEAMKLDRENRKVNLELAIKQAQLGGQLAGAMKDQQSYDEVKAYARQLGLPGVDKFPEQFDPAFAQRLQVMALDAKDQLEQQWKALGYDLDAARFEETKRHNARNEEIAIRGQDRTDIRARDANIINAGNKSSALENQLRDEFNSITKEHRSVVDAYGRIVKASEGTAGVNDIALIFGYMKMLDPGSVVREGEYANARNAGGVPDRVITLYNQALKGSQLSPQVRAEMVSQARKLYEQSQADMGDIARQYSDIAERNGANPANVVVSYTSSADRKRGGRDSSGDMVLTEADIQATMKSSGRSRQEVIDAAKAKGFKIK